MKNIYRHFYIHNFISGIALKKVEQRENEKQEEANGVSSQTDVASILARRVAVEMSDSDNENASDSEYDSDDWGDESTAWHKSKLAKQKEYFFKSQESLATVIDNDDDAEIEITPEETPETTPTEGDAPNPEEEKDVEQPKVGEAADHHEVAAATTENKPEVRGQLDEMTTASKKTTNV